MNLLEPTVAFVDPEALTSAEFVAAFRGWLENHRAELEPFRGPLPGTMEEVFAHEQLLRRLLWDSGWTRYGWPESCGGLGGDSLLRAIVLDQLAAAGYSLPETFGLAEIVGPTMARFAPALHRELTAMLRGDEIWCQGFSEPDSGSDLASLRTRAVEGVEGWIVSGQKVWTSRAHLAQRCLLLARTGSPESRHRRLSMFLIDLDSPGVTVRPIPCADGRDHLAEVFLSDVMVPADRLVGGVDQGWQVAMYLLQFERGNFAWQRQAWLAARLTEALNQGRADDAGAVHAVGEAYLSLLALRAVSHRTIRLLAQGEAPGAAISVDKILLSTAEKAVLDAARTLLWPMLETGDGPGSAVWRQEWWFSRETSVLGGSVEVQRDILADRILALPKE